MIKTTPTPTDLYYKEVENAAKIMSEYWEKLAKFTDSPERAKQYNAFRLEARNVWKTHASYNQPLTQNA